MIITSPQVESFAVLARDLLRPTILKRDREAKFCLESWKSIFAHPDFIPLDFGSEDSHQTTTLGMMSSLHAIGRGSLDLPFIASVAAQSAIVPEIIARFGTSAQKKNLPEIQAGHALAAVCNSETGSGTNLKNMISVCTIASDGMGVLSARKPLATNASGAKWALVSAWKKEGASLPVLEMYLVETTNLQTKDMASQLTGFRTGNCGQYEIENQNIDAGAIRLGPPGGGVSVFRYCFDLERLYIGVLVSGVLAGLEELALSTLMSKPHLLDKQFIQEKIIGLFTTRAKVDSLVHYIVSQGLAKIGQHQVELSLLKWICAAEVSGVIQQAGEICGWMNMKEDDVFNKCARDASALRFFGGSVELQKMNIFSWITRSKDHARAKAA